MLSNHLRNFRDITLHSLRSLQTLFLRFAGSVLLLPAVTLERSSDCTAGN